MKARQLGSHFAFAYPHAALFAVQQLAATQHVLTNRVGHILEIAEAGSTLLETAVPGIAKEAEEMTETSVIAMPASGEITLFLCGDVMTGRGIDQILPLPVPPALFESCMRSALG